MAFDASAVTDAASDSELELFTMPEVTYIKGKIYDFNPKKHGVR